MLLLHFTGKSKNANLSIITLKSFTITLGIQNVENDCLFAAA